MPRRSTRIKATAQELEQPQILAPRVAEVNRVTKKQPARYDCTTCGRNLASSSFPKYLATNNCQHLVNTCKACSKAWVAAQLESVDYDQIKCPECPETIADAGMKMLAAPAIYCKWDEIQRRTRAAKVPWWRWCLNPKCRAGQVHEPLVGDAIAGSTRGAPVQIDDTDGEATVEGEDDEDIQVAKKNRPSKRLATLKRKLTDPIAISHSPDAEQVPSAWPPTPPKAKVSTRPDVPFRWPDDTVVIDDAPGPKGRDKCKTEDDNICTCHECGAKACVLCNVPYHDDETCEQYQKRKKRQNEKEEKQTRKFIEKQCKGCPGCNKKIEVCPSAQSCEDAH
jgi:hypothetical protein